MTISKSLSLPSQLVIRQAAHISGEALLAVNPPDSGWADDLTITNSWHWHAGYAQQWPQTHHFGATPPEGNFDGAILWLPKEKKLTEYVMAALADLLPSGAPLWLVGEKRSGIKSIHKTLQAPWGPAQKLADGNHSSLLVTHLSAQQAAFNMVDYLVTKELPQPPLSPLQLASYPGVFAYPGIDAGSAMLLEHLPQFKAGGSVLDFACGHGVLGAWLQRLQPDLDISYLDVSAMALAACAKTLELNGLSGELIAADRLHSELPKYSVIVSHPPFHTGQATDYSIGQQFLQNARQHLTNDGELWLVANRFLPWPELIEASFGHCERIAQDNKFAVYRSVNRSVNRTARSKPRRGRR
ncbi:class I SAM-dependent methyltransferase [Pseudidiomarina homiensis]|uniref:class I SAM-dependent methyltransferase n=1 Tax=Pseudidiomarina homiensis TaxID=364198 RepID=UPI00215B6322|nr:class I SAM-dependent methyltransferase [Pseudidiomarina homiensis]